MLDCQIWPFLMFSRFLSAYKRSPDFMLDFSSFPSLPPPGYSLLLSPVEDGIHQMSQFSPSQINDRTNCVNGIFEAMRPLITWLFTDEYLIKLNQARQFAYRILASPSPMAFSRSIRNSGKNNGMGQNCGQFQDALIEVADAIKKAKSRGRHNEWYEIQVAAIGFESD
jgi:hypothetical protein